MGWEASCLSELWECLKKRVAPSLMYAILFCCLHISFVNGPLKIHLSVHVDTVQCCGSFCFYCFLFFANSSRSGSPHFSFPHSTRTLPNSVKVACMIQQHESLLGLECLPKSWIQPFTCPFPEVYILTNG